MGDEIDHDFMGRSSSRPFSNKVDSMHLLGKQLDRCMSDSMSENRSSFRLPNDEDCRCTMGLNT